MNIFRFTNFDMGVGNGSFKKQIIYRLGYRTYWGNIRLTFHISILKILFFSLLVYDITETFNEIRAL